MNLPADAPPAKMDTARIIEIYIPEARAMIAACEMENARQQRQQQ